MRFVPVLVLLCGAAGLLRAQSSGAWKMGGPDDRWEVSGIAGGSLYHDVSASATNPLRKASVGFFNGVAVGAVLGQLGGQHWGGEFHYLFQTNNMRLRAGAGETGSASFSAKSHAFHYDALFYFTRRDARIRHFIAGGPGLKVYQATGQEQAFRPLSDLVVFSHENDTKFMVSAGGGVKVKVYRGALVRFDFRDYATGIPKSFTAVPGVKLSGQFHNFVATGGIGVTF